MKRLYTLLVVLLAFGMMLSACSPAPAATEEPAPVMEEKPAEEVAEEPAEEVVEEPAEEMVEEVEPLKIAWCPQAELVRKALCTYQE